MNRDRMGPIRIGRIDYTNVWPVFYHFHPEQLSCPIEMVQGMPASLNRQLGRGEIDMSAVSSFAYALHPNDYLLLPNLSVSTRGPVQSILLFLKSPLEKALNGTIALTTTSLTSVNLLKIIVEKFYGGSPTYQEAEPDLEAMLANADAALLIGDHAIRASWSDHGCEVIDLGECWNSFTGQGMTYAVWAVRQETALQRPEDIALIYEGLTASKQEGLRDNESIIARALQTIGGTESYWRGYFAGLRHDFGKDEQEGLALYFRYAKELGLLPEHVAITEWAPPASTSASPDRSYPY